MLLVPPPPFPHRIRAAPISSSFFFLITSFLPLSSPPRAGLAFTCAGKRGKTAMGKKCVAWCDETAVGRSGGEWVRGGRGKERGMSPNYDRPPSPKWAGTRTGAVWGIKGRKEGNSSKCLVFPPPFLSAPHSRHWGGIFRI